MHEAVARLNFERDVALLTPRFTELRRWVVNRAEFPTLDITILGTRPLRVRLGCESWDDQPPTASLLTPADETLAPDGLGNIFNPSDHQSRPGPFLCTPGFFEYHTHPSHTSDLWDSHRGRDGMNLPGLLVQISSGWRRLGHG